MQERLSPTQLHGKMNELLTLGVMGSAMVEGPLEEPFREPFEAYSQIGLFSEGEGREFLLYVGQDREPQSYQSARIERMARLDVDSRVDFWRKVAPGIEDEDADQIEKKRRALRMNGFPDMIMVIGVTAITKQPAAALITLLGASPARELRRFRDAAQRWVGARNLPI